MASAAIRGDVFGRDGLVEEELRQRRRRQYINDIREEEKAAAQRERDTRSDGRGGNRESLTRAQQSHRYRSSNTLSELIGGPIVATPNIDPPATGLRLPALVDPSGADLPPSARPMSADSYAYEERSVTPQSARRTGAHDPPFNQSAPMRMDAPRDYRPAPPLSSGSGGQSLDRSAVDSLHSQLRSYESLVSTLTRQLDHVEQKMRLDGDTVSELVHTVAELRREAQFRRSEEAAGSAGASARAERSAEVARLEALLNAQEDRFERQRRKEEDEVGDLKAEIGNLKSLVDAVQLEWVQQGNDIGLRLRSLESGAEDEHRTVVHVDQRGRQVEAKVGDQRSRMGMVEARVEDLGSQLRQEGLRVTSAEQALVETTGALEDLIARKDRDTAARLDALGESMRRQLSEAEQVRAAADAESVRRFEADRAARDAREAQTTATIQSQIKSLEGRLTSEGDARAAMGRQLTASFADRWRQIEEQLVAAEDLRDNEDKIFRREFIEGLKSLRESIGQMEEEMVTNREAVEALVRTEVNARMQSELALGVKVDGIRDTVTAQQQLVESMVANTESRVMEAHERLRSQMTEASAKLRAELTEKLADLEGKVKAGERAAKTRADVVDGELHDVKNQLQWNETALNDVVKQWNEQLGQAVTEIEEVRNEIRASAAKALRAIKTDRAEVNESIQAEARKRGEDGLAIRAELSSKASNTMVSTLQDRLNEQINAVLKQNAEMRTAASTNEQNIVILRSTLQSKLAVGEVKTVESFDAANSLRSPPPESDGNRRGSPPRDAYNQRGHRDDGDDTFVTTASASPARRPMGSQPAGRGDSSGSDPFDSSGSDPFDSSDGEGEAGPVFPPNGDLVRRPGANSRNDNNTSDDDNNDTSRGAADYNGSGRAGAYADSSLGSNVRFGSSERLTAPNQRATGGSDRSADEAGILSGDSGVSSRSARSAARRKARAEERAAKREAERVATGGGDDDGDDFDLDAFMDSLSDGSSETASRTRPAAGHEARARDRQRVGRARSPLATGPVAPSQSQAQLSRVPPVPATHSGSSPSLAVDAAAAAAAGADGSVQVGGGGVGVSGSVASERSRRGRRRRVQPDSTRSDFDGGDEGMDGSGGGGTSSHQAPTDRSDGNTSRTRRRRETSRGDHNDGGDDGGDDDGVETELVSAVGASTSGVVSGVVSNSLGEVNLDEYF